MILSMCICSNTSKDASARLPDEECDKVDQIWLFRKPIWLEPDQEQDTIWWLQLSPGL